MIKFFDIKLSDEIKQHLMKNDIDTMIHYSIPIHKQPLYSIFNYHLPKAEEFSKKSSFTTFLSNNI